jgi:3-phenylpropionate/trans-cinnamate dioxygenase ferredoxin subunit
LRLGKRINNEEFSGELRREDVTKLRITDSFTNKVRSSPKNVTSRELFLSPIRRNEIDQITSLIMVISPCTCIPDSRDESMSALEKKETGMVQAARTTEIPEGTMKGVIVAGKQVLIAHVGERFYAMDAICSHMSGYLPAGTLHGNLVTCPIHEAEFDLTSGKVIKNVSQVIRLASHGKAKDLQVHEVKVVGDDVLVRV